MKTLRDAVSVIALTLLAAGYAGSQKSVFDGTVAEYYARVDSPVVQRLALVLLIVLLTLAFVRDRPSAPEKT